MDYYFLLIIASDKRLRRTRFSRMLQIPEDQFIGFQVCLKCSRQFAMVSKPLQIPVFGLEA